jgi:TonB family protein
LITLALHGAVLGAVKLAHSRSDTPVETERDFVVAKMVKLGKPREKFWLPRIVEPPRPQAPPAAIKVTDDPNAQAAPPEAPRPEDPDLSKQTKRALERARKLAALAEVEPEEGLATGSAEGTANEASAGDEYATAISMAIRKNWNLPVGLVSPAELSKLKATVRVKVTDGGMLSDPKVVQSSGNSYFDESCVAAVQATNKVPPPPAGMEKRYARGFLMQFSEKDM